MVNFPLIVVLKFCDSGSKAHKVIAQGKNCDSGPKACNVIAQGNALGKRFKIWQKPQRGGIDSSFVSPFQGFGVWCVQFLGRCPSLSHSAPFGANRIGKTLCRVCAQRGELAVIR